MSFLNINNSHKVSKRNFEKEIKAANLIIGTCLKVCAKLVNIDIMQRLF
jgi:hypothetical protein